MFYVYNLQSCTWAEWRDTSIPLVDDFAYAFDSRNAILWVFGGFLDGVKSNLLMSIDLNNKRVVRVSEDTPEGTRYASRLPSQRTGARMVFHEQSDSLIIFGGTSR